MQIRRANIADMERILELNKLFHIDMPNFRWDTPEWIMKRIEDREYFTGFNISGVTSAMSLHADNLKAEIEAIAIRKELQKHGIGKELVAFAKGYARSLKLKSLEVSSFAEYNLDGFYISCGLKKIGEGTYEGHKYNIFSTNSF